MKFGQAILFKNVIANEDSISIVLETSKTDQFRNGVNIIVQKQTDNAVCPVNHLKKYLACRPPFGGPLFCHYGGKPLTRYKFSAVLKKRLSMPLIYSKMAISVPTHLGLDVQHIPLCRDTQMRIFSTWVVGNLVHTKPT